MHSGWTMLTGARIKMHAIAHVNKLSSQHRRDQHMWMLTLVNVRILTSSTIIAGMSPGCTCCQICRVGKFRSLNLIFTSRIQLTRTSLNITLHQSFSMKN
ncbi:hypothetical protein DdX_08424 [Ditylenchus destructor]|uniref:Uncharacterized protein n=1 Tax=Ditylenchus destructor TaxID=166010 RepID=A0AAD4N3Z3_9BILA|nr:hypothetical protein DdX_08424 [Ditylenchus destructor]